MGARYTGGLARLAMLCLALALLASSFLPGRALGGFWPGVYALLSAYFLICMFTPWIDLAIRRVGRTSGPRAGKYRAR